MILKLKSTKSFTMGQTSFCWPHNVVYKYSTVVCIFLIAATIFISQSINCQTHEHTDCNHQRQQQARQQRQFTNRNPTGSHQQQHQRQQMEQQPVTQSSTSALEMQQQEFSLASGQQYANSDYTLLPQQPVNQTANNQSGQTTGFDQQDSNLIPNTTPALPSDSIGSPVALQPPATTTSSIAISLTQSKPVTLAQAPNMTPTTTLELQNSTISNELSVGQLQAAQQSLLESKQQIATSRRLEDEAGEPRVSLGHQANDQRRHFNGVDQFKARNNDTSTNQSPQYSTNSLSLLTNLAQPVSSSPSSISIITPLIGPPAQQQQTHTSSIPASISDNESQQSAMMKPIIVVGNPISERDYSSTPYDHHQYQQQQQQQISTGESPQLNQVARVGVEPLQLVDSHSQVVSITKHQQSTETSAPHLQQQHISQVTNRVDKSAEFGDAVAVNGPLTPANITSGYSQMGDRISGPPLVYSDGRLSSVVHTDTASLQSTGAVNTTTTSSNQQLPTARLFQSQGSGGASVLGNNPRRPSLPPPVNQANAASGFRSPLSPSGPLVGAASAQVPNGFQLGNGAQLQPSVNSVPSTNSGNFYQTSPPYAGGNMMSVAAMNSLFNTVPQPIMANYNKPAFVLSQATLTGNNQHQQQAISVPQLQVPTPTPGTAPGSGHSSRRPLNITRVEHISAECSNDLIRAVIVFNGTFKGIIYSSGYVNDPTCLYVNGTGSTRYEFSIRLNQCGTLGRQELHQPTIPGEARRRDQVMWNTLSIQYNSIIEQEWDEHFRVSCEYGSDFWKTVSFSPFNVETNTGSPVVFTINPPQCQMDVLLGHGMGPKIAVDGPVTVGDPLTLLIHMKSEKAGYDILVKNCVAHNGAKQRMQLIDSNGCVVNERFISPFRGTYNDNDLRHVTLYAYLKAFRFTGSPVLYLECEIHMCQSACPPQMCYWRRLSKRSLNEFDYEYTTNSSSLIKQSNNEEEPPIISDSLSLFKALQVRQESEPTRAKQQQVPEVYAEDDEAALICYRHAEVLIFLTTIGSLLLLVITIALTCCWRIRKLTRNQFEHNRLSTTNSLSPSLLSISDAFSSAGSILCNTGNGAGTLLNLDTTKIPSGHFKHSDNQNQQHPSKSLHIQRNQAPAISSFHRRSYPPGWQLNG